jgi:hypothetical protein
MFFASKVVAYTLKLPHLARVNCFTQNPGMPKMRGVAENAFNSTRAFLDGLKYRFEANW